MQASETANLAAVVRELSSARARACAQIHSAMERNEELEREHARMVGGVWVGVGGWGRGGRT